MPEQNKSHLPAEDLPPQLAEYKYDTDRIDRRFGELKLKLQASRPSESSAHTSASQSTTTRFPWWRWSISATAIAAMLLLSIYLLNRQAEVSDPSQLPWTLETVETLWEIEHQLQSIATLLDANTRADFLFLTPELNNE